MYYCKLYQIVQPIAAAVFESGTFIRDSGKWHGAIDLVNAHQIGGQKQFAFIWDE